MRQPFGIDTLRQVIGDNVELTYKWAGTITHIFIEELKFVVIKALSNPKIDVVKEMDKVEIIYRFNATMNEILDNRGDAKGCRNLVMRLYYNEKKYPRISYFANFWPFDVLYDGTLCEDVDKLYPESKLDIKNNDKHTDADGI